MVILDNGRTDTRDDNYQQSEEFRHRCEVRWVLQTIVDKDRSARDWFKSYLELVEKARGIAAKDALHRDTVKQWKLGNRGQERDWRPEAEPPRAVRD